MKIIDWSRLVIGVGALGVCASCTLIAGTFEGTGGAGGATVATGTGGAGSTGATTTASGMGGMTTSTAGTGGAMTTVGAGGGMCKTNPDCSALGTTCLPSLCLNEVCTGSPAPAGLACKEDGGKFCNATGSCIACMSSSDCPPTNTSCVSATCSGQGACGTQNAADHSPCSDAGGKLCLSGACVVCISDGDCSAGNVCQKNACVGQCSDGLQDGTETSKDCGGGSCPPCAVGSACLQDNDCVASAACMGGVCTPCVAAYMQPCGSCNGVTKCDGTCSIATPVNLGADCGSCGGKVLCDNLCSVKTPANLGADCVSSVHCTCGYNLDGQIACNGKCVPIDSCSCCGAFPC